MIIRDAHVFIDGNFNDVDVRYDETGIQEIGKGLAGDGVLDANGAYLYAGMVDAHCHGGFLRGFNYSTSFKNRGTHEEQVRYLLDRLPMWQRILMTAGSVGLIVPGIWSDLIGAAILALVLLTQWRAGKHQIQASEEG